MSRIGFEMVYIWRDRPVDEPNADIPPLMRVVYYDSDGEDEIDEAEAGALYIEEKKFNINIKDSIKASIRNGIQCKSEEQSTESFLEQRIIEGLQHYNKSTNGLLLRTVAGTNTEGVDLMSAVRRSTDIVAEWQWSGFKWLRIKRIWIWSAMYIYNITVDLKEFGSLEMQVQAKTFDIGNSGTLTHMLCCDISTRLFQESVRSTHHLSLSLHPYDFYNILVADVDRKISELELPETLQKQLVSTLRWMFFTKILVVPR